MFPFTFPQQCKRVTFQNPHPLQQFMFVDFFVMAILTGILTCIYLITSGVKHLFICFLAICMFPLEKCLLRSSINFRLGCLFFWYWSCMSCLCILEINLLLVVHLKIFSHILTVFILFTVSFVVQKLLSLIRSHLFTFVLIFKIKKY